MSARVLCLLACLVSGATGCEPCMGQGQNGVPDPELDEFQLVFNNIIARNTDLLVDGEVVAVLCEETEYITVGNFPVGTDTTILIESRVSGNACYISPCCSSHCSHQSCYGSPVIDTTAFAGRVFVTGLIWAW